VVRALLRWRDQYTGRNLIKFQIASFCVFQFRACPVNSSFKMQQKNHFPLFRLTCFAAPILAAALSGCVSTGAPISGDQAISPEEARLQAVETKVAELTRRLNGLETSRNGGVADDVRSLRGSVEQLQHDTQQAQMQDQNKLLLLDQRLQRVESAVTPPAPTAEADPATGTVPAAPQSAVTTPPVAAGTGAVSGQF